MAWIVVRSVLGAVAIPVGILVLSRVAVWDSHECTNDTAHVPESNMHSKANTTLRAPANVIPVPGHTHGHIGVHTARGQECACVLDGGPGRGDEHGEAAYCEEAEENHIGTTLLVRVGDFACGNCADTGCDVGRDGHELGPGVGVAHVLDDGGEEEREGVKGGVDANSNEH